MSTMTDTPTTEQMLAAMFTENTGRHFLDSGGAYGRNWERNAGKTVEDFMAEPEVTWGMWFKDHEPGAVVDDLDVTLSAFHWLRRRVEYAPELDRMFHDWAKDSDEPWLVDAETWAELVQAETNAEGSYIEAVRGWNSYNGEDWLSQTLQGVDFTYEGEEYVLLQIHGGCDMRGGYTAPRVFRADHYSMFDYAEAEACCEGAEPPQTETLFGEEARVEYHAYDLRPSEITDMDGMTAEDPFVVGEREDGTQFVACGKCKAPMSFFQKETY